MVTRAGVGFARQRTTSRDSERERDGQDYEDFPFLSPFVVSL